MERQKPTTSLVAAAAVTMAICMAGAATASPSPAVAKGVKNIVLVHGAFADGSSWAKVIPILQARGYNVTAVQNPLTSFADDVAATNRALALQTGPVILVGHSWGGVVITEAGMDPKLVGLVYVAPSDRIRAKWSVISARPSRRRRRSRPRSSTSRAS